MEKQTAINLLGGTAKKAAQAMGCTVQAIYMWPDPLTKNRADRVLGVVGQMKKPRKHQTTNAAASA